MTQRTCNIIGICKKISRKYNSASIKHNIASYMADECCVDVSTYTDYAIDKIIKSAMLDYIDGADKPSVFLNKIFFDDAINSDLSVVNKIIIAFQLVQIREGDNYVNGFSEELLKQMEIDIVTEKKTTNKD